MEPKKIPSGVSPVRFVMSEMSPDVAHHPLDGFEAAKADPDGVAIFEADCGGQIMLTIRMRHVKCTERALDLLLSDLADVAWGEHDQNDEGLYYERIPVGGGVAGGMGGGGVVDGVWIHPRFQEDGIDIWALGRAVYDILVGRADRLREKLLGKHNSKQR